MADMKDFTKKTLIVSSVTVLYIIIFFGILTFLIYYAKETKDCEFINVLKEVYFKIKWM